MLLRKNMLSLVLLLSALSSCKLRSPSELQHAEGKIVSSLPAYVWQTSTEQQLKERLAASYPQILSPDLPINQRLQTIADALDSLIRREYPKQTKHIPKPKILIYKDPIANGYNQTKYIYLRQKVRISPQPSPKQNRTLDLNSPGFIEELDLPSTSSPDLEIFREPSQIPSWNAAEFADLWNSKLPVERKACKLKLHQDALEFPSNSECAGLLNGEFEYIKIAVHADLILLSSELLRSSPETSVIAFLAHEMGHYYQGQVSTLGHNPEYFFLQTAENELQRPVPTELYPEVTSKLLKAKSLIIRVKPIPGARLTPNIFFALDGLYNDLAENICALDKACGQPMESLKNLYKNAVEPNLYNPLNSGKDIAPKDYPTYLAFEKQLLAVIKQLTLKTLDPALLTHYRDNVRIFGLHSFFKEVPETQKIEPWLLEISQTIEKAIADEEEAYRKAATLGLGYYTDEELADELSAEMSAKLGLQKQQVTAVWWQLLAEDDKGGRLGSYDMSVKDCQDLQAKGWKAEGSLGYPLVLLGRLDDIHHSFCYRIFNLEREWLAHDYDRTYSKVEPFATDPKQWEALRLSSF